MGEEACQKIGSRNYRKFSNTALNDETEHFTQVLLTMLYAFSFEFFLSVHLSSSMLAM